MRHLAMALALILCLASPAAAQLERSNDASLLLRTASFGASMDTAVTYVLTEYEPDRWILQAEYAPPSTLNWLVIEAPMGGPNAGYIKLANAKNEVMTLDVLKIDRCYGTAGDIRIGW